MNIPNNIKTIAYAVLAILVGLVVFYGLTKYQENNKPPERLTLRDITQLSEQDRIKALEERTSELLGQVKDLAVNAESGAKYTVYIQLVEAQLELGKYAEAMDTLNKIPEDKRASSRYAAANVRAHKGVGDLAKAKELSAANIVLYEEDSLVWLAHLEVNNDLPNDQLKALYLKAIPATKSNVDVMISYAKFSEKIGDKATAIAAWETARNVDPDNAGKYESEITRLR